jgi:hypothetical protein
MELKAVPMCNKLTKPDNRRPTDRPIDEDISLIFFLIFFGVLAIETSSWS